MGKWIIGIIVVILIVWGVMAAQKNKNKNTSMSQDQNKMVAGDTYKIGIILPLTGDAASYGEIMNNAEQLAADEINGSGGVNGKKLALIVEDGKCNGKDAADAMQKLVNVDKVQVVVGGFCSSESLAAAPIAESNKVLQISGGSSSPKLTNIGHFFIRDYPSDATQGQVLANISYSKEGFKKVAFLVEQQDYALGIYQAFTDEFKKLGGQTVKEEYPKEATDFRTQLAKLKAGNPDALFLSTQTPAATARILKQLKDLNWKPRLLVSDQNAGDTQLLTDYKASLEGALVAEFGVDQTNPKFMRLNEGYKQKYGKDMTFQSYTQTVYDAIYLIKEGIATVGYDGQKLADWARNIKDWQGASGAVTIKTDGDRDGGHRPEVIKDGKPTAYTK